MILTMYCIVKILNVVISCFNIHHIRRLTDEVHSLDMSTRVSDNHLYYEVFTYDILPTLHDERKI